MFISSAYAQAAGATPGGDLMTFLPMIAIFVVFYFLLIRPQQKRAKETQAMLAALQKGDEVVTAGGIVGRIAKLNDQYATIEIAPNVEISVQRGADRAAAAQGHDQGALTALARMPRARLRVQSTSARLETPAAHSSVPHAMNRYPLWKYIVIAVALRGRHPVHAAQLLSRSAGGAGLVEQGGSRSIPRCSAPSRTRSRRPTSRIRGAALDPTGIKVRFADPDTQLKAKDVLQAKLGDELHRRAQPAVVVAAMAGVDRRAADVSGPRPARRRALPAAGRHEGRARQGGRPLHHRHPLAAARARRSSTAGIGREGANVVMRFTDEAERTKARIAIEKNLSRPRACAKPTPPAATCASSPA